VRFCPQCGTPVIAGARFCVECGDNLSIARDDPSIARSRAATPLGESSEAATSDEIASVGTASSQSISSVGAFAGVFAAILIVGLIIAFVIMRQLPARERLLATAAPPQSQPSDTSNTVERGQVPPGHPPVKLPQQARDFIAELERKARTNPNDLSAWNRLGDVTLRAAIFDASYYARAADAYAHVLRAEPDNLNALRGVGNIDFDQRKYDQAIATYEHYLSRKPGDPDVRTDLGTMLLSAGAPDQAIYQYRKVLETHPDFFEANFNLGVAYSQTNNRSAARASLEKSLKVAPDSEARDRVNQMIASMDSADTAKGEVASNGTSNSFNQSTKPGGAASQTFHGGMEQMLRDLPIAGSKVQSVQWTGDTKARVLMDNFPMEQMPPFAKSKFLSDMRAGIDRVKSAHSVGGAVEVDIADAASGRVMESIAE
jgi:cytochrome c-type biogenesis protein CcmH/NrfG